MKTKLIQIFILLLIGQSLIYSQADRKRIIIRERQMGKRMEFGMHRIENYRKIRLMEDLKMDEKQSIQFFSKYNKQKEVLVDLAAKRNEIFDKLKVGINNKTPQTEIEQTVQQYTEINNKILNQEEKFLIDLKDILSPYQVAEYVIFQKNFRDDLRGIIMEEAKRKELHKMLKED